jgi:hypothetical protein
MQKNQLSKSQQNLHIKQLKVDNNFWFTWKINCHLHMQELIFLERP